MYNMGGNENREKVFRPLTKNQKLKTVNRKKLKTKMPQQNKQKWLALF